MALILLGIVWIIGAGICCYLKDPLMRLLTILPLYVGGVVCVIAGIYQHWLAR